MPRRSFAFLIASTIAGVSFAWPLRLLIVGRGCFRIYRASSVLASRPGSYDRRHKLGFEEPIIFWTQREAPCYARWETLRPKNSAHGQKIALTAIVDQMNNFAARGPTAKQPVLPISVGSFLESDAPPPSHPRGGDD